MKNWSQYTNQEKAWRLAVWGYGLMVSGILLCMWNLSAGGADSGQRENPDVIVLAWVPLCLGVIPLVISPFYSNLKQPVIWVPIFSVMALILAAFTAVVILLVLAGVGWALTTH